MTTTRARLRDTIEQAHSDLLDADCEAERTLTRLALEDLREAQRRLERAAMAARVWRVVRDRGPIETRRLADLLGETLLDPIGRAVSDLTLSGEIRLEWDNTQMPPAERLTVRTDVLE